MIPRMCAKNISRSVALLAWMACLAGVILPGCVKPGRMDPNVVSRYQEAMLQQGPQHRDRPGALSSYLPPTNEMTPQFVVTTNPDTGWRQTELSLDDAIMVALANNLDVRVASYSPAVAYEDIVVAAAAFDYRAFADYSLAKTDQWGRPPGYAGSNRYAQTFDMGIEQDTITGASWSLTGSLSDVRDRSLGDVRKGFVPSIGFDLRQPLLRGGWVERNLSGLRIARINHRISMSQFRNQVQLTVTEVIAAYWELVRARRDLEIQEDLLAETIATYERVVARREIDGREAAIKQSEAAVESRRAILITARQAVEDAENQIGRLLADATLNAVEDIEIIPITPPATEEVRIDVADQLVLALQHNPTLEQARLAIRAAEINVRVAENELLPRLDFTGGLSSEGGGVGRSTSMDRFYDGDYINFSVGLEFEYPIGNRERQAQLRQRRYQQLESTATLQQQADLVGQQVRNQIRGVYASHDLIFAQGRAVEAQQEQLDALVAEEEIRGRLTPEFLRVKLSAQESLALSQRAEIRAIVDYNVALAQLELVTGTVLESHGVQMAMPSILNYQPAGPGQGPESPLAPTIDEPLEEIQDDLYYTPEPVEEDPVEEGSAEVVAAPGPEPRRPLFGPAALTEGQIGSMDQ